MYILAFCVFANAFGQSHVAAEIDKSVHVFLHSPMGKVASISYYITDEKGKLIYQYQGEKGLTTASTQKIFTAGAALELLSPEYTYRTAIAHDGIVRNGILHGNIYIEASGDPTFGSWRYEETKPEVIFTKIINALQQKGIQKITGGIYIDDSIYDFQTIPGGWAWNDLGNYYGAGVFGLNWRENQFDIHTKNGKIQSFSYPLIGVNWVNELQTGGNRDQSIIYTAPFSSVAYINGTLPTTPMTVSGATPNPPMQLGIELNNFLTQNAITVEGEIYTHSLERIRGQNIKLPTEKTLLTEIHSPQLKKIIFHFLRKSVNLYGETLVKTLAKEKGKTPNFSTGVSILKDFWVSKGIPQEMLNFADGSGLSPQNYVSAKAEVLSLLYAQKQPWFSDYFEGFPKQSNGMKMKSGTMKNTKSFAGIHTSKAGKTYVFSIIINNYQGADATHTLLQMLRPML